MKKTTTTILAAYCRVTDAPTALKSTSGGSNQALQSAQQHPGLCTESPTGHDRGDRQMNQWVALDYADGLSVVGPFRTCDEVWRWVESLPAWRQALVRPAQMERPTYTTGVTP